MIGFELRTSGVGSDRSSKTTFYYLLQLNCLMVIELGTTKLLNDHRTR